MTIEELLGELWGLITTWGPAVVIIFAVLFLGVTALAIFIFAKVFRTINETRQDINRRRP